MNISRLLSTKQRECILKNILFKQGEISVADLSRTLGISKGFVSRFCSILSQEKIIRKSKNKYIVIENLNVRILKILFNLKLFSGFNFGKFQGVTGGGIYGSCAKGENTEDSDIDIWLKIGKRKVEELAKLTGSLKKVSARISPLYLTEEKIEILKKEDQTFYNSILHGSIKLFGGDIV